MRRAGPSATRCANFSIRDVSPVPDSLTNALVFSPDAPRVAVREDCILVANRYLIHSSLAKLLEADNMLRLSRHLARTISCSALAISSHAVALGAQVPLTSAPLPPSLVTSGQAEEKVTPDRVSVLVNVQTRAATAAAAAADNAKRTRAVLDALAALGLSKDQLSTEGYTAYPEMNYDRPGNTPRVVGYVVTNSVRAESKRVDQAGPIIDAELGAGANIINRLSFYTSSFEEARRK